MAMDLNLPEEQTEKPAAAPQKTRKQLRADVAKLEVERRRHDNDASNLMLSALVVGVAGVMFGLFSSFFWLFLLAPAALLTAAAATGPIPKWGDCGDKIAKIERKIKNGEYAPEVKSDMTAEKNAPANTDKPKAQRKTRTSARKKTDGEFNAEFTAMAERIKALESQVAELTAAKTIDKPQPRKMPQL